MSVTLLENLLEDLGIKIDELNIQVLEMEKIYQSRISELTPLERANFNITLLYAVNSLFFMYMNLTGEDLNTGIKIELDRVKNCLKEIREIEENLGVRQRKKVADVNKAKRIIKNAMFDVNEPKGESL